jgi:hypothetical protein
VGDVPDTYRPADFSWHGNHRRKFLAKNAEKSRPISEQKSAGMVGPDAETEGVLHRHASASRSQCRKRRCRAVNTFVKTISDFLKAIAFTLCAEPDWVTYLLGGPHSALTERIQHDWIRTFQNPWIGRALSSLLADAGVGDRRQEALKRQAPTPPAGLSKFQVFHPLSLDDANLRSGTVV